MKRVTLSLPVEVVFAIESIANDRTVYVSAVYREALSKYIMDYKMKGNKK